MRQASKRGVGRPWVPALMGVALAIGACGEAGDPMRDRELASPAAQRLVGVWTLRLIRSPEVGWRPARAGAETLQGTLALIESRTAARSTAVRRVLHVGSSDADLARWGPLRSTTVAERAVVGRTWGDSVELVLGPEGSDRVVRLCGTWAGDSVLGRWEVRPRAARATDGRFTLTRAGAAR